MKISKILQDYNTDKNKNRKRAHCYGLAYDHIFEPFKLKNSLDIVEIGVEKGWSIKAWRDFFPNARIEGIDIENTREITLSTVDYIITDVKKYRPTKLYDIVIDDGSHKLRDVLYVVNNFKLKVGGVMIIEDCQAPYHWFEKIRSITNYAIELIDMRNINNQHDDFLIVLRNYGYYK